MGLPRALRPLRAPVPPLAPAQLSLPPGGLKNPPDVSTFTSWPYDPDPWPLPAWHPGALALSSPLVPSTIALARKLPARGQPAALLSPAAAAAPQVLGPALASPWAPLTWSTPLAPCPWPSPSAPASNPKKLTKARIHGGVSPPALAAAAADAPPSGGAAAAVGAVAPVAVGVAAANAPPAADTRAAAAGLTAAVGGVWLTEGGPAGALGPPSAGVARAAPALTAAPGTAGSGRVVGTPGELPKQALRAGAGRAPNMAQSVLAGAACGVPGDALSWAWPAVALWLPCTPGLLLLPAVLLLLPAVVLLLVVCPVL